MKQIHTSILSYEGGVPYIQFPVIEKTGIVRHGFSTRRGGVSEGTFSTMNLSFSRGDDPLHVMTNYKRIGHALKIAPENMVLSAQTHTTNVRVIDASDRGRGITREKGYQDVDGMITNVPGICLVTSHADCVPLYFVDPVHKAIGLSHSGWRGTVGKIGRETIMKMTETYHTDPSDLVCAIGPSICQKCYEVSEDVADAFKASFSAAQADDILIDKKNGKYQLDLWKANYYIMTDCGVKPENIAVTQLCTSCESDLLWSHRKTHGMRGGLSAFLQLKDEEL